MPASIDSQSRGPSPNRGGAVKDAQAAPNAQTIDSWRKENGIDVAKHIKLVKLSHMRYQHKDFEKIKIFMKDFGMRTAQKSETKIWYAGYGTDQYVYVAEKGDTDKFLGGVFLVESEAELDKAALLPGAGKIEVLDDAPGGGKRITLVDPEGFPVSLIWGQAAVEAEASAGAETKREKLVFNTGTEKHRVKEFLRFKEGPAAVHKLGHFGLCVQDFHAQCDWYLRNFNLAPSDFLYIDTPEGTKKDVALFAHIDRGADLVDHHTFFMTTNPSSHVHHCSFEVHDFDTQLLGHKWLDSKGYKSVWGVGRHILGSQIFDYWWDTSNFMVEHYADGDLVNNETPIGHGPASDEILAVWGPDVPATFLH